MKSITHIFLFVALLMVWYGCKKDEPTPTPVPDTQGVSGKVIDAKSKLPLGGVEITLKNAAVTIRTDKTTSDGLFTLKSVPEETYAIYAEKKGYVLESRSVTISKATPTQSIPFELKPNYEILPESVLDFGSTEVAKSIDLKNNLDQNLRFSITTNDQNKWFTIDPLTGNIPKNGNKVAINITLNRAGLTAGSKKGAIEISFGDLGSETYNVNFDVPNAEAPSVTSEKPTSITSTAAQITGTITSIGKGIISKYGHVWSETPSPTCCKLGSYTNFGSRGVGSYVSTLTGLVKAKTYFVRAYAENEKGINYSYNDEYNFTTPTNATEPSVSIGTVDVISTTSAKATGRINDNGGSTIVEYGHVWSKTNPTPDPESEKTKTSFTGEPTNGDFISNITNLLEPNTKYYIVAYAKNSSPKPLAKSAVLTFNTPLPVSEPKLTTSAATDIDYTSVTLKGSVTELGSSKIVEHGFVYSKSNADPKVNAKNSTFKNLGNLSNTNPISTTITGLLKGMNYYYRTYVKTENGDYYYAASIKTVVTNEDNLVYHWTLDEGLSDVSGNSNHSNGAAKTVNDRFLNTNRARDLSAGAIYEVQSSKINISTEMTVSMWLKPSDGNFSGTKKIIYGHSSEWCWNFWYWSGFFIYFDPTRPEGSNNILLLIRDRNNFNETIQSVVSKDDIDINQWQQLIVVKSGRSWLFYINGALVSKNTFNINSWDLRDNRSFVGVPPFFCKEDNFGNPIVQVDDIRRYNKAFTDAEVLELYNREK
jgi:hypothetical protein